MAPEATNRYRHLLASDFLFIFKVGRYISNLKEPLSVSCLMKLLTNYEKVAGTTSLTALFPSKYICFVKEFRTRVYFIWFFRMATFCAAQ